MRASKYAVLAFLLPLVAGAASRRTGFLAPPQLATSKKPAMTPHKQLVSESSSSVVGSVSFGARSNPLSMSRPRRTSVMTMGLFGLGGPEIVIILAVASFVIGPQKLAEMAKGAGTAVGELQDVPKGFKEGFDSGSTSEETKKTMRELGKTTVGLKDTAKDLAGDYKEVASEFAKGIQEASREVNKDLVGGLQETNKVVADTRAGVKEFLGTDAEVVKGEKA